MDLRKGPSMIFDLFPRPTGLVHISQIKVGPVLSGPSPVQQEHCPCKILLVLNALQKHKPTSNQDPIVVDCWKQTLVGTPSNFLED